VKRLPAGEAGAITHPVCVRNTLNVAGFTLLETLIAASIFASVSLIAVATFTKMNGLTNEARAVRQVAETGRFVMEEFVRSLENANGTTCRQPVVIRSDSGVVVTTGPGTWLDVWSSDVGGVRTNRRYGIDPTGSGRLVSQLNGGASQPLADADVRIATLAFSGIQPTASTLAQPYVTVSFTVESVPTRNVPPAVQAFQTSVSLRDYDFPNRPATDAAVAACEATP
jgi:prepilin-type N-terminal cleavage/methylation domain-containing protein